MRLENCHVQFDPPLRDGETEGDRLAELQRKMRSGQTGGWRPISEAPKDGTPFLAYTNEGFIGQMQALTDGADGSFVGWTGPYSDGLNCDPALAVGAPTHFMFLPEPPTK